MCDSQASIDQKLLGTPGNADACKRRDHFYVRRGIVALHMEELPSEETCRATLNSNSKPAWDFCFSGYVQSIDPSSLTLRRAGRDAQPVQISKNTSVRVLTRLSAVEDIKVGDEIIACGSVENGEFVAESLNLSK